MPKPTDDTTPSSWMARLEAAKRAGVDDGATDEVPTQIPEDASRPAPPPIPVAPKPSASSAPAKPAHLLVAELDEEEARERKPVPRAMSSHDEIAGLEIARPVPVAAPKRRLPVGVTVAIVVTLVGLAVGGALFKANKEPPPKVETVNPELIAKKQRLEQALDALEDGHVLLRQKKTDEAIASYRKALELEPTLAKAERGLGIAYAAKGDKPEAVAHYRKYLELDKSAGDADEVKKIIEKFGKESAAP